MEAAFAIVAMTAISVALITPVAHRSPPRDRNTGPMSTIHQPHSPQLT